MTGSSGLVLADDDGGLDHRHWAGVARVQGPSWARLPSLTVGFFGVQVLWSVEMSYASPYLVSLGMSKSGMAAVFLAGPLSGLVVQPLIGIIADNSKSRFGRRRPIIFAGAVLCCCATLLLGYTKSVASIFVPSGSLAHDVLTVWLAVLAIYCIDFSINAVQALDRALIVDILPTSEQPSGNAWAGRMLAIGSVVGFYVGNVNLPAIFPFLGNVQLEVVSVIASLSLISTHLWAAWCVKERVLIATHGPTKTLRQEVVELWRTFRQLPRTIYQICVIQFFSSLAWYPVLFYTSLYIGELYKRSLPNVVADDVDIDTEATRLGSRALFYSALVALVANLTAPSFVIQDEPAVETNVLQRRGWRRWIKVPRIRLLTLWAISHTVFAGCMWATYFTTSVTAATFVIALTGFCAAVGQWAPFALLAEAILSNSSTPLLESEAALELGCPIGELGQEAIGGDTEPIALRRHHSVQRGPGSFEGGMVEYENTEEMERRELFEGWGEDNTGSEGDYEIDDAHSSRGLRPQTLFDADPENDYRGRAGRHWEGADEGSELGSDRERTSGEWKGDEREELINSKHLHPGGGERLSRLQAVDVLGPDVHRVASSQGRGRFSGGRGKGRGLSAQAGTILGIHNIFIVLPQFLVTGLSAFIFSLLDPEKSVLHGHHPGSAMPIGAPGNGTIALSVDGVDGPGLSSRAFQMVGKKVVQLLSARAEGEDGIASSNPNAIAVVFSLGGFASIAAFVLTCRLAR
ncbi:major facilitator superfamily domain-containing protein [Pisolithus marmoratus]|nr:major facilitator superfamily domain-containing protein [Pisolithus marmoratus]